MRTVLLLFCSNIFMTFAWYGHLKFKESWLPLAVLVSWGIAFFEYWLAVPANRWGSAVYSPAQLKTMQRDVASLTDHASYLSNKITFVLDAMLGVVNLEQNNIIKLFSVMAVVLMPPTLIASIYGMNFKEMPELEWHWGYPLAICLMIAAAIVPYVFFRWKKWL